MRIYQEGTHVRIVIDDQHRGLGRPVCLDRQLPGSPRLDLHPADRMEQLQHSATPEATLPLSAWTDRAEHPKSPAVLIRT
ncbi:hypothetical protein IVB41_34185 [Bradyrhizobium sp. 44]|nr:hypothetical protein [Bradyrhizobium sp. 44]